MLNIRFIVFIAFIIISSLTITVTSIPENPEFIIALNEPAVVLINVQYNAQFTLPYPDFIFKDNKFIFSPQNEVYYEYIEDSWKGTGFIITSDGYILTSAHISDPEYYKKFGYLQKHSIEIAELFMRDDLIHYSYYDLFLQSYYSYILEYGNFTQENEKIMVNFGNRSYLAQQVASGDPIGIGTSKDIALLKIDSQNKFLLPTVQLGNSDKVTKGDNIIILGFTEDITMQPHDFKPRSTSGKIVEVRPIWNWSAFKTDAEITFGYSGGPVLNTRGEVIAIATFGVISPINQTKENFLIPINISNDLLDKEQVKNMRSIIDNYYEEGIKYFLKGEYKAAIIEFNKVLSLNPIHIYAQNYRNIAQREAEKDITSKRTEIITNKTSQETSFIVEITTTTIINYKIKTNKTVSTIIKYEKSSTNYLTLESLTLIVFTVAIITSTLIFLQIWKKHSQK